MIAFRTALACALTASAAACGGASSDTSPKAAPGAAAPAAAPAAGASAAGASAAAAPASGPLVVVYKDPNCGCCNKWVDHMRQNGFRVEAHDTSAVDGIKDGAHVPVAARSCHIGLVNGYAIEGHVPAETVRRLLRERPAGVAGLAVPGMVTGSPGMEGPNPQRYDVVAFTHDGRTSVYEKH